MEFLDKSIKSRSNGTLGSYNPSMWNLMLLTDRWLWNTDHKRTAPCFKGKKHHKWIYRVLFVYCKRKGCNTVSLICYSRGKKKKKIRDKQIHHYVSFWNCMCCLVTKLCPILSATQWTVACQAPLSTGFLRQEYWSGLPFPSPKNIYIIRKMNNLILKIATEM